MSRRPPAAGCVVVLLSPRLGPVLPAAALPLLRAASAVHASSGVPAELREALAVTPAPPVEELLASAAAGPVALIAVDLAEPAAAALHAAGAQVLGTPEPAGAALLAAVAVMDRLRSPGGCPWDAEQTHTTLRQYLIEETYELLEAIEHGDRQGLLEELGDVLLQVLFHARLAAEDIGDPFDVDAVATALVDKLVGRHPHVFAGADAASAGGSTSAGVDASVRDAASQERRWEELKRTEKRRESSVDGVALGQPAIALAAKLVQRAARAGLPADLLPGDTTADESPTGSTLFAVAARGRLAGHDPEAELRVVARRFAQDVRAAEQAARQAGIDPATLDAAAWRRFWPASPAR